MQIIKHRGGGAFYTNAQLVYNTCLSFDTAQHRRGVCVNESISTAGVIHLRRSGFNSLSVVLHSIGESRDRFVDALLTK